MRKFIFFLVIISLFIFIKINLEQNKLNINLTKSINQIKILNLQNLSEEYILKSIEVKVGESFWNFNSRKLKNDLSKINEIENFYFQLSATGVLEISIDEKKPFMVLKKKNESIYLDDEANPLNFSKKSFLNLIKVNGYIDKEKLKGFNDALKKFSSLRSNIEEIFYIKNIGWKLIFNNKKCLYLPEKKN